MIQDYIKHLEDNLKAVKLQVMSLSYHSNGALSYSDACLLSNEERIEWIEYIKDLHDKGEKDVMKQEFT